MDNQYSLSPEHLSKAQYKLLKMIKANEKTKNTKIVILTNAYVDKKSFIESGASDVLMKTELNPDQLIQKIQAVLV